MIFSYAKPVRLNTSLYILYLLYFYTKHPEQAPTPKPDLLSTHPELIAAFLSKRAAGRHSRTIYFLFNISVLEKFIKKTVHRIDTP